MTTSNPTVGALVSATVYVLLSAVLTAAQPAPAGPTGMTPETKQVGVQIGLGGLLGVPVGEFADDVAAANGVSADVSYRFDGTSVQLGAIVASLSYDGVTRRMPLQSGPRAPSHTPFDVTTSNKFLMAHGRIRLQPTTGTARPYVEGLLGLTRFYTQTSFISVNDNISFRVSDFVRGGGRGALDDGGSAFFSGMTMGRATNSSSVTISGGGGGGILLRLAAWSRARLHLDLGAQYVYAGESDYLVADEHGQEIGSAVLSTRRSPVNIFLLRFGSVLSF